MVDVDVNLLIDKLIGASGEIFLAADRYKTETGTALNEYQVLEAVTSCDETTAAKLISRYRLLTIVKTFSLIQEMDGDLRSKIQDLKPSELAKTHASLLNTFGNMTRNGDKTLFDYDVELAKLADELELSVDEVKADVKQMMGLKK
jgi:hypothetical protein